MDVDSEDPNGHVVFRSFGRDQINQRTALDDFSDTAPMMRPVTAELATRTLYDEVYGICEHRNPLLNDPLSLVGYHPKEDLYEGSTLAMLCRDFYRYGLASDFGMSLMEFLELPMHVADDLIDIAKEGQTRKAKELKQYKLD